MKRLYLVRHAKSSWDCPGLEDFDRPLNKRGMRDAPGMGEYLAEQGISPRIIVSSPARRAYATAISLASAMQIPSSRIVENGRIYTATVPALAGIIQAWEDSWEAVMMVGHNPGIADTASMLAGEDVGRVPTCTVIELNLDVSRWSHVKPGCGDLIAKIVPSMIR